MRNLNHNQLRLLSLSIPNSPQVHCFGMPRHFEILRSKKKWNRRYIQLGFSEIYLYGLCSFSFIEGFLNSWVHIDKYLRLISNNFYIVMKNSTSNLWLLTPKKVLPKSLWLCKLTRHRPSSPRLKFSEKWCLSGFPHLGYQILKQNNQNSVHLQISPYKYLKQS